MDMRDPDAALQPYLRNLESLPFVRRVRVLDSEGIGGGGRFDALLELTTPDSVHTFLVELRTSHLSTDLVPHVISLGHGVPHLLLMAPSIGRSVAEELASAGIDYATLCDNILQGARLHANLATPRPPRRSEVTIRTSRPAAAVSETRTTRPRARRVAG